MRRASFADVGDIIRLAIEVQGFHHRRRPDLFTPEGTDTPDEVRARIAAAEKDYWVALHGGRPVGYAYASLSLREGSRWRHPERVYELRQMGVAEGHRGKGIGRRLWEAVRERAEALEVDRVLLTVWGFNREGLTFYERMGFTPFRHRMSIELGRDSR